MKKPRVILADDQTIVLDGLRKLLEEEFDLVGTAQNGRELLRISPMLHPDLIVLDICMSLLNGIETARQLAKIPPVPKLVFLTEHSTPDYVTEAFRAGGSAYLLKKCSAAELIAAMHQVVRGFAYVTPLVAKEMIGSLLAHPPDQAGIGGARTLTRRQREVLQLIAEGHSSKEIASILKVSPRTVEFHRACIVAKLGLHTTAEMTKYAMAQGITGPLTAAIIIISGA